MTTFVMNDQIQTQEWIALFPGDFLIDASRFDLTVPGTFTPEELADPWVRIRPSTLSTNFRLRFKTTTPKRMFGHHEAGGTR